MYPPHSIAIIGGGITGLAAAYALQETARSQGIPLRCTLIEGSPSLGGKILTERVDGFTVEGGPDSFIRQKPWAAQLAQQGRLPAEEADRIRERLFGTGTQPEIFADEEKLFWLKKELAGLGTPEIFGGTGNCLVAPDATPEELEPLKQCKSCSEEMEGKCS